MKNRIRKWIEKKVLKLAEKCQEQGKIYYINGGLRGEDVYLVRYIVYKSKWGCIYIHRFMRSDADHPHDHPWNFFTYIVSGGYKEYFYNRECPQKDSEKYHSYWTEETNIREPGNLAYRRATDVHRVELTKNYTIDEIQDAPLTICFIGPRLRHWGFWVSNGDVEGSTWVDWRDYLNMKPDDDRIEGSE